jgi:pimeloyl-ACP methyl ester carboxylesterase
LFQRRWSEIQAELLEEQLDWLTVPTLIVQGKNDTAEAIARSRTYAEKTPNAQLRMIDHGGNDFAEALPELIAQYIHEFVNRVEGWKVEG